MGRTARGLPLVNPLYALPQESESDFQASVLKLAHLLKWRSYHTHRSDRSPSGWPDLALVKPPRLLLVELKAERGTLSVAQAAWLADLRLCPGVEVFVWRPADWAEIRHVLGAA